MVEILRNKNLATKFQILVEIADSGPNIKQRDIARRLEVTPQAISDYIKQLSQQKLVIADGRSRYRVTNEGVNWIIKTLRELRSYSAFTEKAINNISVCAAVAGSDLTRGQVVGLEMMDGLLVATARPGKGARGITTADARAGADVGITRIEGIVGLKTGKISIVKLPGIENGGSRRINIRLLKTTLSGRKIIGAIGIEAIVALRRLDIPFSYIYGVSEAAIEAAKSGLSPLIASVDSETSGLIGRLEAENIDYEVIDLSNSKS
ncbi:MarR family transcriptional regulator [Chloroflexota bacterium]